MQLSFSLGQHRALLAIESELQEEEFLFASLDDMWAESVRCMFFFCEKFCRRIPKSECTKARRMCGTGKVSNTMLAMCWKAFL